ncbi:MAG: RAMP superfamily CRISPR-associated protein [Anaerolineae bacterium]
MYTLQRFLLMTLDPVHIGTGGYRLGRADLSIAREPGTNLPKIPGTSLAGAARSYAAMRYEKPGCAGQGGRDRPHCGNARCPICYTFGNTRGIEGGNAGTVSLADAQLLLFSVHSMAGPVWVSTEAQLRQAGFTVSAPDLGRGEFAATLVGWAKPLNLSWLLLDHKAGTVDVRLNGQAVQGWEDLASRLILVEEGLFSQIVNSNLEVRTSVSIDPLTGAAKEGALFTYEALPRAAWLWCDVVEDDYRPEAFPQDNTKAAEFGHQRPLDVVKGGLTLAEYLGIGGMGTRGFGRIKLMHDWEVNHA